MRKLIVKGQEITAVRIASGESAPERYAAAELEKYLGQIAGISFEGDYPITLSIDPAIGRDGFRISVSDGDGLTITGGNGRGVIYGVYELLERYAGCRFFMPDLETLGKGDMVVEEDYAFTPVFEMRASDWQCGNDIPWSVKNRINNRHVPFGTCFPPETGGCQMYAKNHFVHTMTPLTGDEVPCLTNPETLKKAIASVRRVLQQDPGATIISVSQNDEMRRCQCERCSAVEAEEGSYMGVVLRFVNAVADDIREDYPHVVVDTLAYRYTRQVPRLTKPRPNVCIRLCSIECCFSHPLNDPSCPENISFCRDIVDWGKICDRIYIWDYVTNFAYYIPPFPNFGVLRQNMRFFADHGARGMYPEGNYSTPGSNGEFAELRCYLLAKLMWNPYMPTTEYYRHMDEFLAAYYGEGWRYIRAVIDLLTKAAEGHHVGIYDNPFKTLEKEWVSAMEETLDSLWDKAEAMAGDRVRYVKLSRLQWRYMKLMLHPDQEEGGRFLYEVNTCGIKWKEGQGSLPCPDTATTPDQWL